MAVRVLGLERLQATLRAIVADIEDGTDRNRKVAAAVTPLYQRAMPSRTGRMRRSARTSAKRDRSLISVTTPYAGVVTFGWPGHSISPHRWDRKAEPAVERVTKDIYETDIDRIILKHGAGP